MSDLMNSDDFGELDSAEKQDSASDEGERLVRKMTHEVEPGDMTAPMAQ